MYAHPKIISKIALVFIYSDIFKRKTYNGWRKIDIVLKFIIESCANVIV